MKRISDIKGNIIFIDFLGIKPMKPLKKMKEI